jgi:hypothetical protein
MICGKPAAVFKLSLVSPPSRRWRGQAQERVVLGRQPSNTAVVCFGIDNSKANDAFGKSRIPEKDRKQIHPARSRPTEYDGVVKNSLKIF